jgi:nucleoside-diphosphate-sugar epimerase
MRLQAVHSRDVADAFVRAVTGDARGAFNLAAEPPLTGEDLADILGARHIAIPRRLARSALWMGWHARLVPTQPQLLDLALDLPIIDASRAVDLLGWRPRYSSREAIEEMIHGIRSGAGGPTAPLARDRLDRRMGEAIGNVVASPRH